MSRFTFHDVKQNTPEWYLMRAQRLTSSKLAVIMAGALDYSVVEAEGGKFAVRNNKSKTTLKKLYDDDIDAEMAVAEKMAKGDDSAFSDAAHDYAANIAIERLTGKPIKSRHKSKDMDRGHEEEPMACHKYQKETFYEVSNGGFYASEREGCSPDGRIVAENGIVEFKSAITTIHRARVNRGSYDPHYYWQLIGNMHFPTADWIDFVSYCSDYPERMQLYIFRMLAGDYRREFEKVDDRLSDFHKLVDEIGKEIMEANYINLTGAQL